VIFPAGGFAAAGLAVTVAVKVTGLPNSDGFADEATVVVVAAVYAAVPL
jgi:hypothetical protein